MTHCRFPENSFLGLFPSEDSPSFLDIDLMVLTENLNVDR